MDGRLIPGGPGPANPQGHFMYGVVPWWLHLVEFGLFVAFVIIVALVIWAVLRSSRVVGHSGMTVSPALTELDLRYARGEISRDDYFTRRADLMGAAGPGAAPAVPPSQSPPPAT